MAAVRFNLMARFFFNLSECGSLTPDPDGRECEDADAAFDVAVREARELMAAEVKRGKLCLGCHIEVTDASHDTVAVVRFRDVLKIVGVKHG